MQGIYIATFLCLWPDSSETMVLITNFSFMFFIMNILKMAHHEARPFWVFDKIKSGGCYTQFGNPSGHALFAVFFSMYLWRRWFTSRPLPIESPASSALSPSSKSRQVPLLTQIISFIVMFSGAILIGYSRFILGVHSAN